MPANQSLGVRGTRRLDTAIREISVSTGSLVLTPIDGDPIVIGRGEDKAFDPPQAGFTAFAPTGSRFHVTYETDPAGTEAARKGTEPPKPRRKRKTTAKRKTKK